MFSFSEVLWGEVMLFLALMGLLTILLTDILDWTYIICTFDHLTCSYGYEAHNGPLTWKEKYKCCNGKLQSPININTNKTCVFPVETPLQWSAEYNTYPVKLRMHNDGRSVFIYGMWENKTRPKIYGGQLDDDYEFVNARFRWGSTDENGSEHSINFEHFAMELQVTHIKSGSELNLCECGGEKILIISYFYQITPVDNPYLDNIIYNLKDLRKPYSRKDLTPFPLSCIAPVFTNKYFAYKGSLTYPPCIEGVQWIVQPEPLAISSNQLKQFRKIFSEDGALINNTRPVQEVNEREILYIE